jgi:hypothetical protein
MKKLFVILLSMIMAISVSAQRKSIGGHYHRYYRPRTRIIVGMGGFYPYYPLTPYDYYLGYPPHYARPSRLALQIEDIRSDYKDRIWSVRHDKKLSRSERKKEIHELKSQRDRGIRDVERNYHRSY